MDEWKQIAVYFYLATLITAAIIVLGFFGYTILDCITEKEKKGYGNVCVSDDEQDISLEMPKYSDELEDEVEVEQDEVDATKGEEEAEADETKEHEEEEQKFSII
mgnify:CR=1 FL=1